MSELEKQELELELGQVIRFNAPSNAELHNKNLFIEYLDETKIKLLDPEKESPIVIGINMGIFNDESIESIEILYTPEEKGYARQNNLIVGRDISIRFGGKIPLILNGEITNIENDQIEIKEYLTNKKLYIDFKYQGLPENLNIISIEDFDRPGKLDMETSIKSQKRDIEDVDEADLEIDEDELDDLELNYDEMENMNDYEELIISADELIFDKDKVEKITQMVEVKEEHRRYSVEQQTNDLLDDLLSEVVSTDRTPALLNKINTIITRFKDLRLEYSNYNEDGTVSNINKKYGEKEHKAIIHDLLEFKKNIHWLLPIVKNKKKLYDVEVFEDSLNEDVIVDEVGKFITEYNNIMEMYKNNDIPSSSEKYQFVQQRINNIQKNFLFPDIETDVISSVNISADINTVVDNLGDFYSSVSTNENITRKQYYNQKYIVGQEILHKNLMDKRGIFNKKKIIQNESIHLKGFIVLPMLYKYLSKVNLPKTNIYKKTILHGLLGFNDILNNIDIEKSIIDESFETIDLNITTKNPYEVSFKETLNLSDRAGSNTYEKFLESLIPSNEYIIRRMAKYNKKTSYVDFIDELETFSIYPEDIHFKQYSIIVSLIENNILEMKKTMSMRESKYLNVQNYPLKNLDLLEKLFETDRMDDVLSYLKQTYKLDDDIKTSSNLIKNIINRDGGFLMNILMSMSQNENYQEINFEEKITKELSKLDDRAEKMDDNTCKQYTIVKMYNSMEKVKMDNGKEEVYYDREYDDTRYDIMEDFEEDKAILKPEVLLEKITEHLVKNVGVKPDIAKRDAISMMTGKKKVTNNSNELAVLDMGDYEYRYFERKNNNWRLIEEFNDKMPDDTAFCNLKDKCLNINNSCDTLPNIENKIQKKLLDDILNNFSENIKESHKNQRDNLVKLQKMGEKYLQQNLLSLNREFTKKDKMMREIASGAQELEIVKSPYSDTRDNILSEVDIVKKYSNIIIFVSQYCRGYEPTSSTENMYWFYCKETDVKLLPTFLYQLADAFENGDFQHTLQRIIKDRGVLSDDGDKVVDKYSGYTIKLIQYSNDEGYDADGYKIKSRDVMEEDIGETIMKTLTIKDSESKTKLALALEKLLIGIDKTIGIDLVEQREFVISKTILILNQTILSRKAYENKIEQLKRKKKAKGLKTYTKYYDENLMLSLICVYIITLQSTVPSIQTSKTFPGCVKSFSGYPLEDEPGNKNLMNYVVCILLKIRGDGRPWTGLPNIRKLSSAKSVEKLENYILKIKKFMDQNVLTNKEISKKLEAKRQWIKQNRAENLILDEFNIQKWSTFLPPLFKFKVPSVKMLGESFKRLLKNSIVSGSNDQFKHINILIGKIKEFSFNIQSKVNEIIEEKDKLFITNSGIPYMENACCNDKNINTFNYFAEINSTIKRNADYIELLESLKKDNDKLMKTLYIFSQEDTKLKSEKVNNTISEETIYRAIIKYCKFNTGLSIDSKLQTICGVNKANFSKYDPIDKKIQVLKNENNAMYVKDDLDNLISLVHTKINLDYNSNTVSKKRQFELALENINTYGLSHIVNEELMEKFKIMIDRYGIQYEEGKKDERVEDFILHIQSEIEIKQTKIIDFFKRFISSKSGIKKINEFFDKITDYETISDNNYMSKDDATFVKVNEQLRNMIYDICIIFPEIIKNNVEYEKKHIPTHWKLSLRHKGEMERIIFEEFKDLKKVYNNDNLNELLAKVRLISKDIIILLDSIPFYADVADKKTIFNGENTSKIYKYLLCLSFEIYINLLSKELDVDITEDLEIVDLKKKTLSIDDDILRGQQETLRKIVSNTLRYYIIIFIKRKKLMSLSRENILNSIMKSKVKEKSIITERLKDMSKERREIENLMKNHKLGNWGLGQTRALFEYDENQYDKERMEMDNIILAEMKAGVVDDVTMENRDIYMMEHLEEQAIEMRENEALKLDMRDEGERDGEELW